MRIKLLFFLICLPLLASFSLAQAQTAATTSDLQSLTQDLRQRIQELAEQIAKMQKELVVMTQKLEEVEEIIEFKQNLYSGVENEDVKKLQEFLSQQSDIYPEGKVTGYFGPLTRNAIKRFQEKYADDILKPLGLIEGTGYVGSTTRAKLNGLIRGAAPAVPAVPAVPATSATPAVPAETPAVPATPATPAVPAQPATTTPDTTAPANVTNLTLAPAESLITLSWKNPTTSDFAGTKIIQKMWSIPIDLSDGSLIYDGLASSTIHRGTVNGLSYCYKAFTYDEVPNYSSGIGGCAMSSSTATTIAPIVVTAPTPTVTPTPTTPTVDTTAPVMSNFQPTGTTTDTTPTISLSTNESATCKYASTTDQSYDSMPNTFSSTGSTSHSATMGTLATATYTYYARCQDTAGNKNTSSISTTFAVNPFAPDTTAPIISSIQATSITTSSAAISWSTDEESTSVVEYGISVSYGSTASGSANTISHQVSLSNLASSTVYHYRVKSTDSANNTAQSSDQTFTTLTPAPADTTPPSEVTNFTATAGDSQISLSWTNPISDVDFVGVKIVRKTGGYPTSVTDGTLIYTVFIDTGIASSFTDIGLTNGITYYYKAFTYDRRLNYSSGAGAAAIPTAPVASGVPQFLLEWSVPNYPHGVAIDGSNNVYVAKGNDPSIQKFTSAGVFITQWGSKGTGQGQFTLPMGIDVDGSGNVYVMDRYINDPKVIKFTSSGIFVAQWGSSGTGDGQFGEAYGIAVDAGGNVYVADTSNNRVQKFTNGGVFITQWGSLGTGDGQFKNPSGIAVDSSGNVYVIDRDNNRIQKFTSNGTFITKWGSPGTGDGQLSYSYGIAIDSGGNVYVADGNNDRVQKFTSEGVFILKWGSYGTGDGQFRVPWGIDIDGSGNIYVVEYSGNRVQKFSSGQTALLEQKHLADFESLLKDIQFQVAAISAAILELFKR